MLSYSQMQNHQMVIQSLGQGYYKVEDKTRGKVFQLLCYYFFPPTSMGERSRTSHLKLNERSFKEISCRLDFYPLCLKTESIGV